ncbi:hypothetical protein BJ322DRAFT_1111347 [Thelephora terrestris]|uniref:Peptidase M48 domain-containing protein n=1 Tax=Thelephora terrestris TaxID=56493 RepID=A0A9P6H9K2_9AGAM|nr:hypothetical protein BJ322DRAFT_1111347 [Thelephora terrestris]
MLPIARGLFSSLRAGPRPSGRLLKLRPPPIAKSSSALGQFRQFSSTRPKSARYFRFEVDPEQPLNYRRWSTGTQVFGGIVVLSVAYYVTHLETVPETGRRRFMDVGPKFETMMAEQSHHQLLEEFRGKILPPDHPLTQAVRDIVTRILDASNLGSLKADSTLKQQAGTPIEDSWHADVQTREGPVPGSGQREWRLIVVHDPKIVNAMASFGNIVVFTGIIPVARDEDGLAAILGHEIAHVVARHTSERYSSMKVLIAFATLLEVLGLDVGVARFLTTYLLELPNSRTQELEADVIGLRLSAKACYNPEAAPEMFNRMGKLEQAQGARLNVDFLYTHPTSESRVKMLEAFIPEARSIRANSSMCIGMQEQFESFQEATGPPDHPALMNPLKVAIIGGGPSSFYVASRLLSLVPPTGTQQLRAHIYDRLWSPHGLVRYGVAPDHPEVKNCTHKFDQAAQDPRLKFFGNVNIGGPTTSSPSAISVPIESLLSKYTHLVLGTGCTIPVLHSALPPSERCIPALEVVHWYTNHPSKPKAPPIDEAQHVSIIGQGNVSLDIARILLSRPEDLKQYDIPERVLSHLAKSTVKRVSIIGRRGPYEVAFTAKELRELLDLPGVVMDPLQPEMLQWRGDMKPTRQQSRIVSLLERGSKEKAKGPGDGFKSWSLEFFRSPTGVVPTPHSVSSNLELSLAHTTLDAKNKAVPTGATSILPTDLIITSLGHRSEPTAHWYDPGLGHVRNVSGRVIDERGNVLKNVYTSGWASTGAKGVLATTMMNAYDVAQTLLSDAREPMPEARAVMNGKVEEGTLDELPDEVKRGLETSRVITYESWKRIDEEETRRGTALRGKERERMEWNEVERYLQDAQRFNSR